VYRNLVCRLMNISANWPVWIDVLLYNNQSINQSSIALLWYLACGGAKVRKIHFTIIQLSSICSSSNYVIYLRLCFWFLWSINYVDWSWWTLIFSSRSSFVEHCSNLFLQKLTCGLLHVIFRRLFSWQTNNLPSRVLCWQSTSYCYFII